MTKDDKLTIYNLLKAASGNFYGYATAAFAGDVPEFADDAEIAIDAEISAGVNNSFATDGNFSTGGNSAYETNQSASKENFSVTENIYSNEKPNFSSEENLSENKNLSSLPEIDLCIKNCHACGLSQTRTNTVTGMGVENPLVIVVGEGPGQDEDRSGLPFVGAAGKLLDKMLIAIQLDRNKNCYIANVVKCRPPNNRTPTYEEAAACGGFLRSQIDVLKPKMILAAGRTAAQYLLETDAPLGKLRGTFYDYHAAYGDVPLLVTYHPSALLRDESNKRPAWEDLKMFKSRLLEIAPNYDN